jgi:hypothetical protein
MALIPTNTIIQKEQSKGQEKSSGPHENIAVGQIRGLILVEAQLRFQTIAPQLPEGSAGNAKIWVIYPGILWYQVDMVCRKKAHQ